MARSSASVSAMTASKPYFSFLPSLFSCDNFGDSLLLSMATFDYESWINQARERLELLYEQKDAISNEIAALERGIEGFLPLTKNAWIGPSAGITESVRKVLSKTPYRVFAPTEIRDQLLAQGVKLEQKNAMATIHQVLSRLVRSDLVKVDIDNGKNRYRWVGEDGCDDIMKKRPIYRVKRTVSPKKRGNAGRGYGEEMILSAGGQEVSRPPLQSPRRRFESVPALHTTIHPADSGNYQRGSTSGRSQRKGLIVHFHSVLPARRKQQDHNGERKRATRIDDCRHNEVGA